MQSPQKTRYAASCHPSYTIGALLILAATMYGCQKNGGSPGGTPGLASSPGSIALVLPRDCGQSFSIKNTGGTSLSFYLTDDDRHSGILSFGSDTAQLPAGDSAVISVTVKDGMMGKALQLSDSILTLHIFARAGNTTLQKTVPVTVRTMASLSGNWSGTWDGVAVPKQDTCICQVTNPADSVHGTWSIHLGAINPVRQTVRGSLHWQGTDAYYTYTYHAGGDIASSTVHPFAANITFDFDSSNASITPDFCTGFYITVSPKPGNDYGPVFQAEFDAATGIVYTTGNGFESHPYDINHSFNYSVGQVKGVRQ